MKLPHPPLVLEYAVGYGLLFSLILGSIVISLIYMPLYRRLNSYDSIDSNKSARRFRRLETLLPLFVGVIERALYFWAAFLFAYPVVAGWIALKAILKFGESKDQAANTEQVKYHLYLLGCGLSLLFGLGGGIIARYLYGLDAFPRK